jgi:signal transduction histidine kinase
LHFLSVDLCKLLLDSGADHEALFASHGVQFDTQLPPEKVHVLADPMRIAQIVGNVLHNAARFTPPGGRVVLALQADEAARVARIQVQDSGVGVDLALRDRLFEPFVQADTSLARSGGGLGLGLALVKKLVELHGGSVRAESDGLGQGSTFIVELPYASEKSMDGRPAPGGEDARTLDCGL